jgi:hypothetical protein
MSNACRCGNRSVGTDIWRVAGHQVSRALRRRQKKYSKLHLPTECHFFEQQLGLCHNMRFHCWWRFTVRPSCLWVTVFSLIGEYWCFVWERCFHFQVCTFSGPSYFHGMKKCYGTWMFISESLRTTHHTPHSATSQPSTIRFNIIISSRPRYHKRYLVVISPTTFLICLTNRTWQHYTGQTVSDPPHQQTHALWCPLVRRNVNCYTDRKPRQCLNLQAGSVCVYAG